MCQKASISSACPTCNQMDRPGCYAQVDIDPELVARAKEDCEDARQRGGGIVGSTELIPWLHGAGPGIKPTTAFLAGSYLALALFQCTVPRHGRYDFALHILLGLSETDNCLNLTWISLRAHFGGKFSSAPCYGRKCIRFPLSLGRNAAGCGSCAGTCCNWSYPRRPLTRCCC